MKRLRRLLELAWLERAVLLEAVVFLGLARLFLAVLPFRWIRRLAGSPNGPIPQSRPRDLARIQRIGTMIELASRNLPWFCLCLAQAIAGRFMLRWRGIPGKIFIGVMKDEQEDALCSHAWLKSGDLFVTGEKGHDTFTVITEFVRES